MTDSSCVHTRGAVLRPKVHACVDREEVEPRVRVGASRRNGPRVRQRGGGAAPYALWRERRSTSPSPLHLRAACPSSLLIQHEHRHHYTSSTRSTHGRTGMHDTDTREVGRTTLIAALAVRVVGGTDHCRQSSHQGLGVVLHRRTCRRRGQRTTATTTHGRVKDQSAAAYLCCALPAAAGSERKLCDEDSWSW